MRPMIKTVLALVASAAVGACSSWTPSEKGTAIGAAAGGAAGHAISGGSLLGTVGGAAAGGFIGHEIGEEQED